MANKYIELATKLHDRAIELDSQLKNLQKINGELVVKCEKCLTSLREFANPLQTPQPQNRTCKICCQTEASHVFIPCGHLFCENCCSRGERRGRCFTCRGNVERILKVFI